MTRRKGRRQLQQNLDPSTEPASVDEELSRVGVQSSHLAVQAGLLRHRNQDHSPIYTLPPEVLIAIFLLRCTSEGAPWEKFGTPTRQVAILSSVSSYWRQVVLETPSLWNTVTLMVRKRSSEAKAALLQHHLIHAKDINVSLDLPERCIKPTIEHQIFKIIFAPENAQKVTTLRVKYLPVEWLAKLSQFPRLHTLVLENIRNEDSTPVTLDLHTQPLRRFSLSLDFHHTCQGLFNFPSSVQELMTHGVASSVGLEFLRQCPNLTKVIGWHFFNFDMHSSFFPTPLTLGRLGTLSWPAESLDPTSVQNLSLPALKDLRLRTASGGRDERMSITTFCHKLSETLTSLELCRFVGWKAQDFQQFFLHKLECLEILKLIDWPLGGLIKATRVLTPSAEEFGRNELPMLPSLRHLVLTGYLYSHITDKSIHAERNSLYEAVPETADDMIFLFLDLLKKRGAGETTPFRLDMPVLRLPDHQKLVWSNKQREVFRHAIAARHIELLQDGRFLRL